jgi:hypothetical protein
MPVISAPMNTKSPSSTRRQRAGCPVSGPLFRPSCASTRKSKSNFLAITLGITWALGLGISPAGSSVVIDAGAGRVDEGSVVRCEVKVFGGKPLEIAWRLSPAEISGETVPLKIRRVTDARRILIGSQEIRPSGNASPVDWKWEVPVTSRWLSVSKRTMRSCSARRLDPSETPNSRARVSPLARWPPLPDGGSLGRPDPQRWRGIPMRSFP